MILELQEQRQQLHQRIDLLSSRQLLALSSLIDVLLDPFEQKLASAPFDDEPVSIAEQDHLRAELEWARQNTPVPLDTFIAKLGITEEEIRQQMEADLASTDQG